MEVQYSSSSSAAITILSTLCFFSSVLFLLRLRRQTNKKCKFPPGSRGWPVIGDSLSWYNAVAGSHPPAFVERQVSRFGKVFSCSLFGRWAVVSADPGFNRFVQVNEGKLFKSSYPKSFRDLVGENGVVIAQGEQQRKLHGIASSMMRVEKRMDSVLLEEIQLVMIRTLGRLGDGSAIRLQDVCRKVAINQLVNQLFGISTEEEVNEMAELFSDFVDGCLSVPVNLPGFAYHTGMKAREKITSKINKIVEKSRAAEREHENETHNNGLLGRVLKEGSIEDGAISDFIINLMFAGNETTAKTMVFAVYFLTRCPKAMQQLLEEHDALKSNEMLTWEDYKAMPFTQCVIDETLRLGGIAIWLFREAMEDVTYQDYVIPKGCLVVPFLAAVHLDENLYEGAVNFNPWRWMDPQNQKLRQGLMSSFDTVHGMDELKEKRNWRSSSYFTPFGGGARFCPGAELARLQIALFLHYFVTTYRWTQIKDDRMSFFPSARLVNGLQIRLSRRRQQ